jgi:hypothetical protein
MAFGVPRDPTTPPDPLVIPRRRPQSVTLAGVLLYGSGAVGLLSAVALLVAALAGGRPVLGRGAAQGCHRDAFDMAGAMRAVLLSSGFGALVLAVLSVVLGRGVLRRNEAARIGALVVAVGSLGCALVRTSVTAFGGSVDWTVAAEHTGPALDGQVAQSFGDAMPGWLVGIGGGLTDLQTLGYIAVAILLLAPASLEYFRTRLIAPTPPLGPPV